jgi:uncharacterized protein (DUF488 family)
MTIMTLGYHGKPLATFVGQLCVAQVDGLVDIRLRNTSHLAGYTKRDDLAFLLREGFGIAYEHRVELAPTPEILDEYRLTGDWAVYEVRFHALLIERDALAIGRDLLSRYQNPCLLCAEPTADHCHRRLVAEYWAANLPDLKVIHL